MSRDCLFLNENIKTNYNFFTIDFAERLLTFIFQFWLPFKFPLVCLINLNEKPCLLKQGLRNRRDSNSRPSEWQSGVLTKLNYDSVKNYWFLWKITILYIRIKSLYWYIFYINRSQIVARRITFIFIVNLILNITQ